MGDDLMPVIVKEYIPLCGPIESDRMHRALSPCRSVPEGRGDLRLVMKMDVRAAVLRVIIGENPVQLPAPEDFPISHRGNPADGFIPGVSATMPPWRPAR